MNPTAETRILSIVSFGLIAICFVLLLQEIVLTRQQWQEVPRIFGGLLAPVPPAIFLAFCFAHRGAPGGEERQARPITSAGTLIFGVVVALILGTLSRVGEPTSEPMGSGPAVAQSSLLTSSILNLLFLRNPLVAAALSGLSVGLVVFVIFLT
jgi:hypothetical protein